MEKLVRISGRGGGLAKECTYDADAVYTIEESTLLGFADNQFV